MKSMNLQVRDYKIKLAQKQKISYFRTLINKESRKNLRLSLFNT